MWYLQFSSFLVAWSLLVTALAYNDRSAHEEEYFGARMRQQPGRNNVQYQQPGQSRGGAITAALALAAGGLVDRLWTNREVKRMRRGHEGKLRKISEAVQKSKRELESQRDMYIEAYGAAIEKADLKITSLSMSAAEQNVVLEPSLQLKLDYQEFKQPDYNGDDLITKSEFNAYIQEYMQQFPNLSRTDIPKFEDFDHDRSGVVSFKEWQKYLDYQRQQEQGLAQNNYRGNGMY